jgi:hypothetical protein
MNLKLGQVLNDITGLTGMAIIKAILNGERDPRELAKLRHYRCKNDAATIARALEGHYRPEHLFALKQSVELFEFYQRQIAACDRQIEGCLAGFEDKSNAEALAVKPRPHKGRRAELAFDARTYLYRLADLISRSGLRLKRAWSAPNTLPFRNADFELRNEKARSDRG